MSTETELERLKQKLRDGVLTDEEGSRLADLAVLQRIEEEEKIRDALLDAIHLKMLKDLK